MKIMLIGDPHGSDKIMQIPFEGIDLILIPGDIGKSDLMRKYAFSHVGKKKSWTHYESPEIVRAAFLEAYTSSLKVLEFLASKAPVYFVYGNVEESDSYTKKLSKRLGMELPLLGEAVKKIKNLHVINNKKVNLKGITLAGSQYFVATDWVERFAPEDKRRMKNAIKETARARKFYNKLGKVDILLCHQPPYGVLDKVTSEFAPEKWHGKHAGSNLILDYVKKNHPRYVV